MVVVGVVIVAYGLRYKGCVGERKGKGLSDVWLKSFGVEREVLDEYIEV